MQRVVRSTLVGLLTVAGLTACGDKITIPPQVTTPPVEGVVREVTVSPQNVTIPVNGSATFAASVNADAGITDRTVTWASSNTTVATIDASTGVATGRAAGTTTITATSRANTSVRGAAVLTVTGTAVGQPPTVTIQGVNQTVCGVAGCNSVPANLFGAAG
jgi:predicted small lipoprotein YifL